MEERIRSLPVRLPIEVDESLISYLVRLSIVNKLPTPTFLYNNALHFFGADSADFYLALEELTLCSAERLYASTWHSIAHHFDFLDEGQAREISLHSRKYRLWKTDHIYKPHFLNRDVIAYCPQCLASKPYHRLTWIPRLSALCVDHNCTLVTKCPNCKGKVDIPDVVLKSCKYCGFNLAYTHFHLEDGESAGAQIQRFILEIIHQSPDWNVVPGSLLELVPKEIHYPIIFGLYIGISKIKCKLPIYSLSSWVNEQLRHIRDDSEYPEIRFCTLATAAEALLDWPRGFRRLMKATAIGTSRGVTGALANDLGGFYPDVMENYWGDERFDLIMNEFKKFTYEYYTYPPIIAFMRRRAADIQRTNKNGSSPTEENHENNLNPESKVAPVGKDLGQEQALVLLDAKSVQIEIKPEVRNDRLNRSPGCRAFTISSAAEFLETTPGTIEDYLHLGILEIDNGPQISENTETFISCSSLQTLITLVNAYRENRPRTKSFSPSTVVDLILTAPMTQIRGLVSTHKNETGSSSLLFLEHGDVQKVPDWGSQPFYTLTEISQILNIEVAEVEMLADATALKSCQMEDGQMVFKPASLTKFLDNYVDRAQAKEILGVWGERIDWYISRHRLNPLRPLGINIPYFSKTEVLALAKYYQTVIEPRTETMLRRYKDKAAKD